MRQFCSYLAKFAFSVILEVENSPEIPIVKLTKYKKSQIWTFFKPKEKITAFEATFLIPYASWARPARTTS